MKAHSRRSARPARLAAAISRDDPFGMEVERGPGFGRVILVFLLLHVIGIGGFAAYKWLNPDIPKDRPAEVAGTETGNAAGREKAAVRPKSKSSSKLDVDELLAPRRMTGTPMVVDHPEMKGYKRYRVGEGERLVEIVRQFHASVAEVEKLNGLRPGDPLFTGQWLTIPDNTGNGMPATVMDEPVTSTVTAKVMSAASGAPKEPSKPVADKTAPKTANTPAPAPAEVRAVPVKAQASDQMQPRPPKAGVVKTYRVVRGDTAYSIARRYNIDWQELLRVNGLSDPRQLRADQVIRIP
jgi:LysM repeat protein